jgi:hypothetical protein
MPTYQNGYIPAELLIEFDHGYNSTDLNWYHALSPATYYRHRLLLDIAFKRTGRWLQITRGWSAYRPYAAQVLARKIWGIGAAIPGNSSHGGTFNGRQSLAMDYGNWQSVYGGDTATTRAQFGADCRAAGLSPFVITLTDEPWHVIDYNPWSAVPAGGGGIPFPLPQIAGDEMIALKSPGRKPIALDGAGQTALTDEEFNNFFGPKYEGNDRQFDLCVAVYSRLAPWQPDPRTAFLGKGKSADRGWALFAPGYFKLLTDEEFGNQPFTTRRVEGNDRQYDLWRNIATSGQGFTVEVKGDGDVTVSVDYAKIAADSARATRDLISDEPLAGSLK